MKQIAGQMSIFDMMFPEKVNPLLEVAKRASPYWSTSRQKIIDAVKHDNDINTLMRIVRNEYCPYEAAGGYGRSRNRRNELEGWDFSRGKVKTYHYDHNGKYTELRWSWADFTREIVDLIYSGEYGKGR